MNNDEIDVTIGDHFKHAQDSSPKNRTKTKAIVFDLDETIGQFSNLQQLNVAFEYILKRPLKQSEFDELLNLYPEFLRPGILTIMEFLYYKKSTGGLQKVYIYTNNQCGRKWVNDIASYIDSKIGAKTALFDDIICAFKIKNQIVEFCRTTNAKTCDDLIKCTMLKEATTEICFIDDARHARMCNEKVYYIKPRPYVHSMSKTEMIARLLNHIPVSVAPFNRELLHNALHKYCLENPNHIMMNKTVSDVEITKKIMYHIREYLYFMKDPIMKIPAVRKTPRMKNSHRKASTVKRRQ